MKNSKKKQQKPQKIYDLESWQKEFRKEAEKRGMSDLLKETPSQPTNKFSATLRPFAKRKKNKN